MSTSGKYRSITEIHALKVRRKDNKPAERASNPTKTRERSKTPVKKLRQRATGTLCLRGTSVHFKGQPLTPKMASGVAFRKRMRDPSEWKAVVPPGRQMKGLPSGGSSYMT